MAEVLDTTQVQAALTGLTDWTGDAEAIARTVTFATFPDAIAVVTRVAMTAEEMDHHPDIDIRWRTLTLRCSTHSAGGTTGLDIELASRIDAIIAAQG
ncbi:4a-hydroxytetrahydrobiopterin dehydratase [Micromonospora sp. NBC_01813]|uniref:4a-hydroxytetrahydrobiopterin dehydratase n=1 Tax=Micromonospora sp. NBC_01813 TaxID=2975988 RepID=UPI002DDC64B2|nr:4a-hydroxytetrahydrobiopterin dehydratase [Micromonospora sp. NBC_01813]WSA12192.1 4a-hydroxytetrahydrobiopterin dehydratase [Micromonospora sp. NBC_01813]